MTDKYKIYGGKDDHLVDLMYGPSQAKRFGSEAWVYSEIAARCMVVDAFEAGKKSVSTGLQEK